LFARREIAVIRRRHVIYVEGYDPQGAEGYYRLFDRSCQRFRKTWPVAVELGALELDSEDFAHWQVEASGPNWSVATRYEFLRQERFIRADMAEPMVRHIPRALWWILTDWLNGTMFRIFRASWRFGLALAYFELLLLLWLALAALAGIAAADAIQLAPGWRALLGLGTALAVFAALRPLADRYQVVQITNHWPRLRRFARSAPTWFDGVVEAGAQRLVEAARAGEADELVLIGHSGGCTLAPAIMARALEIDRDLGRHGPQIVLLTLGSNMAAAALARSASRIRAFVERIAIEPSVSWIECQSRRDILNFWKFDPVAGIGVAVKERHNPLIWAVSFKDSVSPELYRRFRWNFFRIHFQFIMAGDRRGPYEYLMLIGGPLSVTQLAKQHNELLKDFAPDGTFVGAAAGSHGRHETVS
jgi:hypothetical protein